MSDEHTSVGRLNQLIPHNVTHAVDNRESIQFECDRSTVRTLNLRPKKRIFDDAISVFSFRVIFSKTCSDDPFPIKKHQQKSKTKTPGAMHEFPKMCEPRPFSVDEECALDELRRLFATRSDIEFQSDNYFLTKFLRFCDWNPQRAFASCVNYYEMKHMNPTYCASKNVSEYMDLLNLNSRVILDKRDKCGRAILVSKLGEYDECTKGPKRVWNRKWNFIVFVFKIGNIGPPMQFTDSAILDDIYLEILLSDPLTQINGITIIADCKGLKSSILKWLVPKNNKIGASKLESFPVKEWTIHMINMGPILKACIMLVKPFLRKQTIERVSVAAWEFVVVRLNMILMILSLSRTNTVSHS